LRFGVVDGEGKEEGGVGEEAGEKGDEESVLGREVVVVGAGVEMGFEVLLGENEGGATEGKIEVEAEFELEEGKAEANEEAVALGLSI
jgi:hypothetical protein